MRESSSDVWICVATLVLFLYCFFIVGGSAVYWREGEFDSGVMHHGWELKGVEYPTLIFLAPLIFLMFFVFIVFRKELRDKTVWGFLFSMLVAWKIVQELFRLQFK